MGRSYAAERDDPVLPSRFGAPARRFRRAGDQRRVRPGAADTEEDDLVEPVDPGATALPGEFGRTGRRGGDLLTPTPELAAAIQHAFPKCEAGLESSGHRSLCGHRVWLGERPDAAARLAGRGPGVVGD